jgi:23S rRNA (guanine2445-N2)-methyltransferase
MRGASRRCASLGEGDRSPAVEYHRAVPSERIFAACAPGLEPVLAAELAGLGLAATPLAGGVEASGEAAAAVACLGSRVADAVRLRAYEGPAADLSKAKAEAARRYGPGAELLVRREGGRATVSVEAAGEPLFKRGWRARVGAAPLRETLAAGLLLACGWEGDRPFLDPMCGSGTIAIEAALIAGRRAPGLGRTFAFERFPGHDRRATEDVRARLAAQARPITCAIHASDRNMGALRLAQKNAAAAEVADRIRFQRADAAEVEPPPGGGSAGLCLTNPPYGLRLDEDAPGAWRALGELARRLGGWEVAAIGPERGFEDLLPDPPAATLLVQNGGVRCRLTRWRP